jgi:ABC-type multidrug transport system fused ATPase/permease subunit
MITVAHKLNTIRDADVICVMQEGAIIQKGTHASLSKMQGLYRDMLAIQGIQ